MTILYYSTQHTHTHIRRRNGRCVNNNNISKITYENNIITLLLGTCVLRRPRQRCECVTFIILILYSLKWSKQESENTTEKHRLS